MKKTVQVGAPAAVVWRALTDTALVQQWMSATGVEIDTDWRTGSPIRISGSSNRVAFENSGTIVLADEEKLLQYTHLSSLSRLPDVPGSYTTLRFSLEAKGDLTNLTLRITGFPTESIYKHLAFYWNVTLELLKQFVEKRQDDKNVS